MTVSCNDVDLRYACKLEWDVLKVEFCFLREPNNKERKRIELLYGEKVAHEILTRAK
jgi:hypothetical protein